MVKEKGSKYQDKHAIGLRYLSDLLRPRRLKSATIKRRVCVRALHSDVRKSANYVMKPEKSLVDDK